MSDSDSVNLFIGIAATLGALLGVFVAGLLSRSSTTSALRQDWINSLRGVMSDFLTQAETWVDIPDKNSEEAYWAKSVLLGHVHKAKLYLNEKESNPKALIQRMEGLTGKYKDMGEASKAFQAEKREIAALMQGILKEEWNRVRDGEILWSINKVFKLLSLPEWFYISRIRLFWLLVASVIIWGVIRVVGCDVTA